MRFVASRSRGFRLISLSAFQPPMMASARVLFFVSTASAFNLPARIGRGELLRTATAAAAGEIQHMDVARHAN